MTTDPNNPEVLLSVPSEWEAASIVSALADCDIQATTTGGITAGFRAEAPGDVNVIVKRQDLERAREAMSLISQNETVVDWSDLDVGEPEEET